ncbi:hypothetical protein PE074_02915 [Wohlfahrtiimonas chitiniclastica]|uniref:PilZ domain-containing protein n=2 Tax=Wohlfahrtiimonas chitiniclastica TaxID=400946 RepID=L8XTN3_9GAMM|nr:MULTISPECIES: PilZ domain-containing protein [Wohlfahrtiimonas]ELV07262.1 Hypothetical protein F387_01919 [Wohlfahrtiimonas chitiniclastica SH04]KZS23519.1 hypothetical protein BMY_1385 [Wohlfahrtiimonas chitiniclastica]KZX36288.1 hypothetical protein A6V30_07800 [Wohlfahrtiimonas chitiniclastica]KZX36733.1 hypothetical protein A6V30_07340 [Wohlfahrtiimonas chitiniclastica]MBS7814795.1 hypothetical protein [Wohlfahrtiimonas chitiniclastica]
MSVKQMQLEFKDFEQVANVYMDFVVGGGFFIPMQTVNYQLGDEIFIALILPDDPGKRNPAATKVVWINTENSRKGKPGIGVQLTGMNAGPLNERLKKCVGSAKKKSPFTLTM